MEKLYRPVSPPKSMTEVEYKVENKPLTDFPRKLVQYLVDRFSLKGKVLDIMCGRGEHAAALEAAGLEAWCFDMSPAAAMVFDKKAERLRLGDLNIEDLPFDDNFFDVIWCKSAIEHVNADHLMSEVSRVLKPGGKAIILTGDWFYAYRVWYTDHTHGYGVPWMTHSMRLLLEAYDYREMTVENIIYLPFTWAPGIKGKLAHLVCTLVRLIIPYPYRYISKFTNPLWKLIRFSHEVQILGYGVKPSSAE
jgi:SAM-dependent methyltransferase